MTGETFDFPTIDRITVGVIGDPGERVFYIQVRAGVQVVSFKVEKQYVARLASEVGRIIREEMPRPGHTSEDAAEMALEQPVEVEWVVGGLALLADVDLHTITMLLEEQIVDEDAPQGTARIVMSVEQGAALAIYGTSLVEAGRPACPLCGYPLDPKGHVCPKTNGNTPPRL